MWTLSLQLFPYHRLWTIDPSPEFPLVVFGDIKDNSLFQAMLVTALDPSSTEPSAQVAIAAAKLQRDKCAELAWVHDWLPNYLKSVKDLGQYLSKSEKADPDNVFSEALARVFNYCGEELQHNRFNQVFRAKAMKLAMQVCLAAVGIASQYSCHQHRTSTRPTQT